MIIGSILKKAITILATNPAARKKIGQIAFKAYKTAKPIIKKTSETLLDSLDTKLKK